MKIPIWLEEFEDQAHHGEQAADMTKMLRKKDLPTKICASCGRPFAWRKKWERDWEHVRYCSKRCAGQRGKAGS